MLRKFLYLFRKDQDENVVRLPENKEAKFILIADNIKIGFLYCEKGEWFFKYSDEFKSQSDKYHRIVGFPDLNKIYNSEVLWPFFRIRIPGLKQPAIQEILKKENIDEENDIELLKRFGNKTISNPYELEIES